MSGMREKGKFVSADGSVEYDGDWRDGARHGRGAFHLAGVYEYVGEWRDAHVTVKGDARMRTGRGTTASGNTTSGMETEPLETKRNPMRRVATKC